MRRLPPNAPILTVEAMRAAETVLFDGGVSQNELMERAGAAVARETARLAAGQPVLVLAGPGNNGGDAYVAAGLLLERGLDVAIAAMGQPKEGASARMAARWRGRTTALVDAAPRPVVLDGLLGIGKARPFDPPVAEALDALLGAAHLGIAIDVPSGTNADNGTDGLTVDVTIALGALKPAHVLGSGSGHVVLADIGIAEDRRVTTLATPIHPNLHHDVNKFSRGMVVVVAGAMPGAGWLAANAALHGGAGYVVLAGAAPPEGAPHALIRRVIAGPGDLSALLDDSRIGAVVIGPGLGRDAGAQALLDVALSSDRALVIDGDALTLLGRDVATRMGADRRDVCLTPHAGEFGRMFDTRGNKIDMTSAAAALSRAVVVHKGAATVIGHPDGSATVAADASAWLSTAGSGDVLAGLVAARLAGGQAPADAAATATWLHGRAGRFAGTALTADDLITHIPAALAQCRQR